MSPHTIGELGNLEGELAGFDEILRRGWYTNHGPLLRQFEAELALALGMQHCVCACTAELALMVGLMAQFPDKPSIFLDDGVARGVFRSFAFFSWTPVAESLANLVVVNADRDPGVLAACVESHTKAGRTVWVDQTGLGTLSQWRKAMLAGSVEAHVLSFGPGSALAIGSGGAIVTNHAGLAASLRTARNHHAEETYCEVPVRFNIKMSESQALLGLRALHTAIAEEKLG
jgi:dTDP-4-amino-4,6-dideoxygalactose transaminase